MPSGSQLESVTVLIPRTLDQRILLTKCETGGLWLPTCQRNEEETLHTVAQNLLRKVTSISSKYKICQTYLNMLFSQE